MFKLHFPFGVCSVPRVSGHVILNGSLALNKATIENAVRADDFVKVAQRIVANFEAHPPPSRTAAAESRFSAESNDDGFAEQLKKAVEEYSGGTLPTQKQHKEQVERERARYHSQPRPHTKSD